ncbi:MAG: hypothetical protein HY051_01115 [Candidatus Aenigmarchaeota archaeon]|nr:hypothetical protein [Candidatus Aenigmarchaeota archaeon]
MSKLRLVKQLWFVLAALVLLVSVPSILAQKTGNIQRVSYSPAETVILEDVKISIDLENPAEKPQSYYMLVQIVVEGRPVNEQEFTLSVEKSKGVHLVYSYAPEMIGEHQIIARLYDKAKINLLDTEITSFNAVSYLGPFDIIIDPLTSRLRPGLRLPANLILENMGIKGTDAEVRISVNCYDKAITQSLTMFVPGRAKTEKLVSSDVCAKEGLYEISASILIFNKTWVSSTNHFFVNSSFVQLQFEAPENITLQPGQSFTFPIEVVNAGNQKISDLKFIIERIPLAWQKISPFSITELDAGETAFFLLNITVPADAEPDSYEITITAAGDDAIEKRTAFLNVAQFSTPATITPPRQPLPFVPILLLVALMLTGILLKIHANRRLRYGRRSNLVEELKKQVHDKRKFR